MSPLTQIGIAAISAGLPTLTVLVSLLINIDKRFVDLDTHIEQGFAEHRDLLRTEFMRVEQVMDARLSHLEEF